VDEDADLARIATVLEVVTAAATCVGITCTLRLGSASFPRPLPGPRFGVGDGQVRSKWVGLSESSSGSDYCRAAIEIQYGAFCKTF